jgi:hypothetical protein
MKRTTFFRAFDAVESSFFAQPTQGPGVIPDSSKRNPPAGGVSPSLEGFNGRVRSARTKRRNRRRSARAAADSKKQAVKVVEFVDPDGLERYQVESVNPFGALQEEIPAPGKDELTLNPKENTKGKDQTDCLFGYKLGARARKVVRHLEGEWGIKAVALPPKFITCGGLRPHVRQCFPPWLPTEVELSVKTSQKVELGCCDNCEPRFAQKLSEWKEKLFQPVAVDSDHVERFARAFAANVETGWNRRKYPFIPNGHASLGASRRKGGNWNDEEFANWCSPTLVFSSGKPRVVTKYSSYNTAVLTPLHLSLYTEIARKGWCLVGPPTEQRVAGLNGDGALLSFDYVRATDSFKTAYVRRAISVLIGKAVGLSSEEARCLRVLGELRLSPDGPCAESGQPMGSVMSFPLLCLFNKTVVDLALSDLLVSTKIQFKEWTGHRCLINGDDLLVREPRKGKDWLYSAICHHGTMVGMEVNKEKSMVSDEEGEINSTLFRRGALTRKSNVSALWMKAKVNDVLGFAAEANVTEAGFRRTVRANAKFLARQEEKFFWGLPANLQRVSRQDRKIRRALLSEPVPGPKEQETNFIPMVEKPFEYDLPREDEIVALNAHVERVRKQAIAFALVRKNKRNSVAVRESGRSIRSLARKPTTPERDLIPLPLCRAWEAKQKGALVEEEGVATLCPEVFSYPSDLPLAAKLEDAIRLWKLSRGGPSCGRATVDGCPASVTKETTNSACEAPCPSVAPTPGSLWGIRLVSEWREDHQAETPRPAGAQE